MIGIYKITSPTNKIYIGQSINIERRITEYSNLRCKDQIKLYNSINKHGWDNHKFEVLLDFDYEVTNEYLTHCEQFFMDYYREEGFELINLRGAGSKGKMFDETRQKMSISHLGEKNHFFGKKHTEENIKKMRIPRKKVICPHCSLEGAGGNMTRYHFDKCKKIKNSNG